MDRSIESRSGQRTRTSSPGIWSQVKSRFQAMQKGAKEGLLEASNQVAESPLVPLKTVEKGDEALLIVSDPRKANVFLDGVLVGEETPLRLYSKPFKQEIEVVIEKKGYLPWRREVEFSTQKSLRVDAKLVKERKPS